MKIITTPLARQNVLLLVSRHSLMHINPIHAFFGITEAELPIIINFDKKTAHTEFNIFGINYPHDILVPNRQIPLLFRKKSQKINRPKKAKLAP